jgi:hypothetical protein
MDFRKQILITFGIFILLGVPVWWKTTTVYRASLPLQDAEYLSEQEVIYQYCSMENIK